MMARDLGDERFMLRAIELAKRGRGWVEPGVVVGCVIARGDVVLGEGYYQCYGGSHAEVHALEKCAQKNIDVTGADIYVTLEPCSHVGKTGPCAQALIDAGVGRVFVGAIDCDERVRGRGIEMLKAEGIAVEVGICGEVCGALNPGFVKRVKQGLPWVIGKWAQTVDGYVATASGHSQWISNSASRKRVHELRGTVDAVMVGVGTAIKDDVRLTSRGVEVRRQALRVVVDPDLRISVKGKLFETGDDGRVSPGVLLAVRAGAEVGEKAERFKAKGVAFLVLPELSADDNTRTRAGANDITLSDAYQMSCEDGKYAQPLPLDPMSRVEDEINTHADPASSAADGASDGVLDLAFLLRYLAKAHDAVHVLAEGGSGLMGRLFEQRLVDEVHVYVGGQLLADDGGMRPVKGGGKARIDAGYGMSLLDVEAIGGDVLMRYWVK